MYCFDQNRAKHNATLLEGAYLYRLASLHHCDELNILNGRGTIVSRSFGRFHVPMQQTTYCANNILVCIAEVLFHMYKTTLQRIQERQPSAVVTQGTRAERCLVILKVKEITDLVYLDSDGVMLDYDSRICGATTVFPEAVYTVFHAFNNKMREVGKKGILYPSARHSRDLCVALFDDETQKIQSYCRRLNITLQLVSEDQDFCQPTRLCNPFREKLHATMGYYCFHDSRQLEDVRAAKEINPGDMPLCGMVDFVRRRYQDYPSQAVCPQVNPAA